MDDRSPQPRSGPPAGPQDQDAQDKPETEIGPIPAVVPDSDADPRALAAASQPPNVSDILAEQSSLDQSVDAQGKVPYGDAALRGGAVQVPSTANPLTAQRAQSAAAANNAANAGKPADNPAADGDENDPKKLAKKMANDAINVAGNEALKKVGQKYLGGYAPTMPEGDTAGEKTAHAAGQGTDIGARLLADRYAPGLYNAIKNSILGRMVVGWVRKSPVGKLIPKSESFWAGFHVSTKNNGEVTRREKIQILLIASLPLLLPLVAMILIIALLLGVSVSSISEQTQPMEASDRKVAEYFPGDWQAILKDAAERASAGAESHSAVPWTILAGIVKTQTDFGRYSPYDNIDRDPGRTAKELPTPGGGGSGDGGVNVDVSNTRGAGPGPVEGVTGAGSAATVPGSNGHPAPPDGDLSHQLGWFLWALRMQESNGNYTANAGTSESNACGAYQYIKSTWNNYRGYATACDAPPNIQDERAKRDILAKFQRYKKWQQVAASHFYPAWVNTPERWNSCPAACSFNPTVWEYVDGVISKMRTAASQRPPSGNVVPASVPAGGGTPEVTPAAERGRTGATGNGTAVTVPLDTGTRDTGTRDRSTSGGGASRGGGGGLHAEAGCRVPNPDPRICHAAVGVSR